MSNSFVTIKLDNGLAENQSNKILVFLLRRYLNGSQDNVSDNYSNDKLIDTPQNLNRRLMCDKWVSKADPLPFLW